MAVWYRSNEHTYKNTNNNGLFLLLSAVGYVRFHETLYLDYAKKVSLLDSLPYLPQPTHTLP